MRVHQTSAAASRAQRPIRMLCALFVLAVMTQRLAIPLGSGQLPVAFLIYWFAVLWLILERLVAPFRTMALVLGIAFGSVLLCTLLSVGTPSLSSLAYLLALYVPLACGPTRVIGPQQTRSAGRFFVSLMVGFGLLAIVQFGTQRFLHIPYADPLGRLPDAIVMQGYQTSYPVSYGAELYKSNAYLFLEASVLSQFLALAIIVELSLFRRIVRLAVLLAALATTFSGTGPLLLLATCPVLFVRYWTNPRMVVLALLAVAALVGVIATHPELLVRLGEFGGRNTSATARFIEPYSMMARDSFGDAPSFFLGHGAGAADRLVTSADGLVNFSAIPKAIIEYGAIGGIPVLLAIAFRIAFAGQPATVATALIVMHYFLSGALLQPISVLLLFFFVATGSRAARSQRPVLVTPSAPIGRRAWAP